MRQGAQIAQVLHSILSPFPSHPEGKSNQAPYERGPNDSSNRRCNRDRCLPIAAACIGNIAVRSRTPCLTCIVTLTSNLGIAISYWQHLL